MRHLLRFSLVTVLVVSVGILACSDDTTGPDTNNPPDQLEVGDITTWAGTGAASFDGDGHALKKSSFYWPIDVEFTPTLGAFIVDFNNHIIRHLEADGTLKTVAGMNIIGDGPLYPNDGGDIDQPWPATDCALNHPTQVFERNGKLMLMAWHNHKLRELNTVTGGMQVFMGRGAACGGDGGPAEDALLNQPSHGALADDGSIYILDQRNQCIRKVDPSGTINSVVGTPTCSAGIPGGFAGDGGPPADAKLSFPTGSNPPPGGGLTLDAQGRLYISDTLNHRIRRVDFGMNIIETVVGNGTPAYTGDGGDPLAASLNNPMDITFGPDGRLYIADAYNNVVRAVDFTTNVITTVAGNGTAGFGGDGDTATDAMLDEPRGVAFDADGHLYIADTNNHRFRKVIMN